MNRNACLVLVLGAVAGAGTVLPSCSSDSSGGKGNGTNDAGTDSSAGGSSSTGGSSGTGGLKSDSSAGGAEAGGPTCGNGKADTGETCDTGIAAGQPGSCPTAATCDDHKACTVNAVKGADCTTECDYSGAVAANNTATDGCCPPGATAATDKDCSASCGNGTLDAGETCDTAIAADAGAGACITSCADDGNPCTKEELDTSDPCNPSCTSTTITTAANGDSCCPAGATSANDTDCVPTAFRMTSLVMMDPHPFVEGTGTCDDLIDTFNNAIIAPALSGDTAGGSDGGPDGIADLSFVVLLRPEQHTGTAGAEFYQANCPLPDSGTPSTCAPKPGVSIQYLTYTNQSSGTCLAPDPVTVKPYDPPVTATTASPDPCVVTHPTAFVLNLGGVVLTFDHTELAANWQGDPATGMVHGLFKGFLSEASAATAQFSGTPISNLFPQAPASGPCASVNDSDIGPDGTTKGWWWYLTFEGQKVTWTGP